MVNVSGVNGCFLQRPYSLFSTLVDTIKAAKSSDSLDKEGTGTPVGGNRTPRHDAESATT